MLISLKRSSKTMLGREVGLIGVEVYSYHMIKERKKKKKEKKIKRKEKKRGGFWGGLDLKGVGWVGLGMGWDGVGCK